MSNDINKVREHLFTTLEKLQKGEMEIETAKAINQTADTLIETAKVEVKYLETTNTLVGSGFIPQKVFVDENEKIKVLDDDGRVVDWAQLTSDQKARVALNTGLKPEVVKLLEK